MKLIRNGWIHNAIQRDAFVADILIDERRIVCIGKNLDNSGAQVIDASGLEIYPGFVDAHAHTGLSGYAMGYEGTDYNEINDPVCPQMRAIDALQPFDRSIKLAREAGVTCICTGPGSANALGGTFCAIKPVGRRVDDMCIAKSVAMKCAFGENIKNVYRDKGNFSRMSTAAKLREAFYRAQEYARKLEFAAGDPAKMPPFDMKLHALLPVVRGEIPLKAHAHQANDIFTALRIAREFGLRITLEHVTEGHLIADLLAKENVPLAVGPTLGTPNKIECRNRSWTTPGVLARAGCQVSIITDAPFIPQESLALCASMAINAGMDEFSALQAITINPARHIGLERRVGSIEKGKDADLVLISGSPFSLQSEIRDVLIDGKSVFFENIDSLND